MWLLQWNAVLGCRFGGSGYATLTNESSFANALLFGVALIGGISTFLPAATRDGFSQQI